MSERELRLALLSHGSFAHAFYGLGACVQLRKVVRASEAGGEERVLSPTERVFSELLSHLEDVNQVRTRISVDTISGASAGGINATFLAKALAVGGSLDAARDLWIVRGSDRDLLPGPRWLPRVFRIMRAGRVVGRRQPALQTQQFARWIFDVLMDIESATSREADGDTEDQSLELLLTLTDLQGIPEVTRVDGRQALQRRRHRVTISFARHSPDRDQFRDNAGLAFAAQATAALPGFFSPVQLDTFASLLPSTAGSLEGFARQFFRRYDLAGLPPSSACFVDGGLVDSAPLGTLLAASSGRTAAVETDRRLVLIEPGATPPTGVVAGGCDPGAVRTLWEGLAEIPSREAITNDLARVAEANARAGRVREIIETHWPRVEALVVSVGGLDLSLDLDRDQLGALRRSLEEAAREDAGTAYGAYRLAKVHSAVEFAGDLCAVLCDYTADSNEALFVAETLTAWAEESGLFARVAEGTDRQAQFLRSFDLPYALRRLQFVAAGVNYGYRRVGDPRAPTRQELDHVKAILADVRQRLSEIQAGVGAPSRVTKALGVFALDAISGVMKSAAADEYHTPAADYAHGHSDELSRLISELETFLVNSVGGSLEGLVTAITDSLAGWSPPERRMVLVRLYGWPFWDAMLFPIIGGSSVEESPILVEHISPDDAVLLADARQKAYQGETGSLLGFFSQGRRENDYLWGRLDSAEALVAILLDRWHPDFPEWTFRAIRAILEEEAYVLPRSTAIIEELRSTTEQPLLRLQQAAAPSLAELRAAGDGSADADQELPQEIQRELREAANHILAQGREADSDAEEGTQRYLAAIATVQKESPAEPPKSLLLKARDRVCPLYPFC